MRTMGDKIAAKAAMASIGVPLVDGSDGALENVEAARVDGGADWLSGVDQGCRRRAAEVAA